MDVPSITLADKHHLPQLGLGLWKVRDRAEFQTMFKAAVEAGYRHFDSAQAYDNEQLLGQAIKNAKLERAEVFITTKIAVQHFGYHKATSSFQQSLQKLQMDYVDLLLLHFPVTLLRKKAWQALEEIQAAGGTKSIGVSNYTIRHLEEMRQYATLMPAVNQVELHVFLQQPELIEYCHANGIAVEAYSPLAHARANDDGVITRIAKKHDKSYAQIMLRWCIEQGLIVIPKSVTPSRIRENIDIFDFRLDKQDLTDLAERNRDLHTSWDPVRVP